jgi:hypothetical protein
MNADDDLIARSRQVDRQREPRGSLTVEPVPTLTLTESDR